MPTTSGSWGRSWIHLLPSSSIPWPLGKPQCSPTTSFLSRCLPLRGGQEGVRQNQGSSTTLAWRHFVSVSACLCWRLAGTWRHQGTWEVCAHQANISPPTHPGRPWHSFCGPFPTCRQSLKLHIMLFPKVHLLQKKPLFSPTPPHGRVHRWNDLLANSHFLSYKISLFVTLAGSDLFGKGEGKQ